MWVPERLAPPPPQIILKFSEIFSKFLKYFGSPLSPPIGPVQGFLENGSPIQNPWDALKNFRAQNGLNSLKENFMLTKIKNLVSKLTTVEWIVLGVAVLALVVGLLK